MKTLFVLGLILCALIADGENVSILDLDTSADLATVLSNAPNNTLIRLSAGTFPVLPSKVLSNGMGAINIFNKSNITIEGIPGLTIINGSSALGEILYLTNSSHVSLRGLTVIGKVVTNYTLVSGIGHVWASFSMYAVDNVIVENCRFIDGHDHGIHDMGAQPNWNTISTNNIIIQSNYFDNFGSSRSNEVVATDGTAVVPTGWLVTGNEFRNCLRCVEPYSENDVTPNVFYNCVISSNRMINTVEAAILTAGSTNGQKLLIEGNYIYNEPGYARRGTNMPENSGIMLNDGYGHVVRGNQIINAKYVGISIGGSERNMGDVLIENNHIENVDTVEQGFGIHAFCNGSAEFRNLTIRSNWIRRAKNHAMFLLSLRESIVENNTITDPTVLDGPAIKLWTFEQSFNSNVIVRGNTITDSTSNMTYGIEVSAGSRSIRVEDNCITGAILAPILNNAGGEMIFASRGYDCSATPLPVRINEWMAANSGVVTDLTDGSSDDWFELYNHGVFSVNISGYHLTDNLNNKFKFQIPSSRTYIIPPEGYLMVWADNKLYRNTDVAKDLHASFQLRKAGDSIGLFAPDGTTIDSLTFRTQISNVSEGIDPLNQTQRVFMSSPSPSGLNQASTLPTIVGLKTSDQSVNFSFISTPGRKYQIESKKDLAETTWLAASQTITATEGITSFTNTRSSNSYAFYRVILLP